MFTLLKSILNKNVLFPYIELIFIILWILTLNSSGFLSTLQLSIYFRNMILIILMLNSSFPIIIKIIISIISITFLIFNLSPHSPIFIIPIHLLLIFRCIKSITLTLHSPIMFLPSTSLKKIQRTTHYMRRSMVFCQHPINKINISVISFVYLLLSTPSVYLLCILKTSLLVRTV